MSEENQMQIDRLTRKISELETKANTEARAKEEVIRITNKILQRKLRRSKLMGKNYTDQLNY